MRRKRAEVSGYGWELPCEMELLGPAQPGKAFGFSLWHVWQIGCKSYVFRTDLRDLGPGRVRWKNISPRRCN